MTWQVSSDFVDGSIKVDQRPFEAKPILSGMRAGTARCVLKLRSTWAKALLIPWNAGFLPGGRLDSPPPDSDKCSG